MRNFARLGLVVMAVVFGLASLFNLLRFFSELGVSPTRFVIEDAVIALACVVIVVACCLKYRQLGVAQAIEAKATAAKTGQAEFKGSRLEVEANKFFIAFALFFFVTVLTLFPWFLAWSEPGAKWTLVAVLGTVSTIYLGSLFLAYFRPGKPTLVMDSYSLDHAWYGPIRWDQIHGLQLLKIQGSRGSGQYVLVLGVAKPGRYLSQTPWALRIFISRKRLEAAVGDLRIGLKVFNLPATKIFEAAQALRGRVSPPPLKLWHVGMTADEIALQQETEATLARIEQITTSADARTSDSERESQEILRLSEDLNRQLEKGKPFRDRNLARLRRMKYRSYAIIGLMIVYLVFRLWWIFLRH